MCRTIQSIIGHRLPLAVLLAAMVTTAGLEASAPPAVAAVATFSPMSVTYVSSSQGWVLGTVSCGRRECFELLHTTTDGASWSRVPLPPMGQTVTSDAVMKVRFADSSNGWIFPSSLEQGATAAWSTHSGGRHWSRIAFPVKRSSPVGIEDLEAAGGVVNAAVAVAGQVEIFSSPVGRNAWHQTGGPFPIGAGPVPSGDLALHRGSGWFVQNNRVVVGGAREEPSGRWTSWQVPCSRAGGPVQLASPTTSRIDAICTEGLWTTGVVRVDLLTSTDGGARFGPSHPVPLGFAYLVLAASATAAGVSTVGIGEITEKANSSLVNLEMSFDGGSRWRSVYRGAGADWLELGFTTARQGVAIISGMSGRSNTMLSTRDGGRHWTRVDFS